MNKLIRLTAVVFIVSITSVYAVEKPVIGVISAAVGEIYNQNNKKLNNGDKIYFGDSIIVKDKSNSQILLLDETVMAIGSNSEIKIDEFIYDPKTKDGKILSQIKNGSMKVLTGGVSEKNPANLEIKVPAGTIGTRGTEFQATVDANSTQSKILLIGPGADNTLGLRPGAVEVTNSFGTVLLNQPFLFTQMSATTAPQAPIPVPQNELQQFQQKLATRAPVASTQVVSQQKETTEKALFSGDLKKENIIQQIIKNPAVIASLDKQLDTTGNVKISSIVNEQGIVNSQVAINELSKMVDKGIISNQDFFALVGKDEKGNQIVNTSSQTSTSTISPTTSVSTTSTLSNELDAFGNVKTSVAVPTVNTVESSSSTTATSTGSYKYDSGTVTMTPTGSNIFSSGNYQSISNVDFNAKSISTTYTGTFTTKTSSAPGTHTGNFSSSSTTSYSSTPSQAHNFSLSSGKGSSDYVLKPEITGLNSSAFTGTSTDYSSTPPTNTQVPTNVYNKHNAGGFALFGQFSTTGTAATGSSSLSIEQSNDSTKSSDVSIFKGSSGSNIETLSGSNTNITPTKN
jgi:hypothetical protein